MQNPLHVVTLTLSLVFEATFLQGQAFNDFSLAPHNYGSVEKTDQMSQLIKRSGQGQFDFGTEDGLPLLKKILAALDVPESSQILVFSRTSLQKELIGPDNPRAMYFNEDTHVAWMPEGKVEIISFDPHVGGIFFIEEADRKPDLPIRFTSQGGCFGCHGGAATNYLPGPLARSTYTSSAGQRLGQVRGHNRMGHQVPFPDRWGGYFVTGAPASLGHLGNAFATRESGTATVASVSDSMKTDLGDFFDTEKYLRPDSNVLPLLLFDHQIEAHNLIMECVYRWRHLEYETAKNGGVAPGDTRGKTEKAFEKLVRYLLFADEAPLPGSDFLVSAEYREEFRKSRKVDANELSLRDFDLKTRLFSHRLSYMIYARSFEDAPAGMRAEVYRRIWKILAPEAPPAGYEYFAPGEREKIFSILKATKTDLPEEWTGGSLVLSK
jgi:hypothetical protein